MSYIQSEHLAIRLFSVLPLPQCGVTCKLESVHHHLILVLDKDVKEDLKIKVVLSRA